MDAVSKCPVGRVQEGSSRRGAMVQASGCIQLHTDGDAVERGIKGRQG
jgi:hypothetical protein